jgi:RimJ/RimL family protein N-acetyltransferase
MTLRKRFAAEGLWFDLLGPQWLNLTRAWRADPRIRQQFHTDRELSYDEHMSWYETKYEPDVDGQVVWVFGDEACGVIGHVSLYGADRDTGTVTFGRFYVGRADLTGRGYGRRALRAVVDQAFAMGFERVTLDVKGTNERARRLYERSGFQTLGVLPGSDVVHMASAAPGAITHSVVVGSYNRPKYVAQTLRAIVTQSRPNWECVVSDDASNEETLSVIRSFTDVDPRFRLLIAADRPPPGARECSASMMR